MKTFLTVIIICFSISTFAKQIISTKSCGLVKGIQFTAAHKSDEPYIRSSTYGTLFFQRDGNTLANGLRFSPNDFKSLALYNEAKAYALIALNHSNIKLCLTSLNKVDDSSSTWKKWVKVEVESLE